MSNLEVSPRGWDKNEIANFIDRSRNNEYATFCTNNISVQNLSKVNLVFTKAIDALNYTNEPFCGFFLLRAHSNFLASCRLSWSGQIPETYVVLRSCIENSLYAIFLHQHPELRAVWSNRQISDSSRKEVKNKFKIVSMLQLAEKFNRRHGKKVRELYELTIDMGAHPNVLPFEQTLSLIGNGNKERAEMVYLSPNQDDLDIVLNFSTKVGVSVLSLFSLIYPERFEILGIKDLLFELRDFS